MICDLWWSLRAVTKEAFDRHFCSSSILPVNKIMVRMMMVVMFIIVIIMVMMVVVVNL